MAAAVEHDAVAGRRGAGIVEDMAFGHGHEQAIAGEQAMHRAVLALWTMPNSSFVIASAGQTLAHTGSSQCMQT